MPVNYTVFCPHLKSLVRPFVILERSLHVETQFAFEFVAEQLFYLKSGEVGL